MKSKEELEKEPMPYDNTTPKKCPKCGNWFLSYPALSRRDNSTYICPDCGVKEAMEDYMNSRKKEGLEEATQKALLEDPDNEALTKPLTESVDWDYYDKFEDLIQKYMPDQGEGETLASQIVTAINKLVYKWYNDGDVYDNVNSGLQGWANDLSSYANWLYKYAPGDAPSILKNIYGMGEESDYETLLKELADNLLDENLLDSLEKSKQGSIYDCDGPFEFKEYDDEEDEDYWEEEQDEYEEDDLEESKKLQESEESEESITIRTGLSDDKAADILNAVIGQLSDGIWENSPQMEKYWRNLKVNTSGSDFTITFKFDNIMGRSYRMENPFMDKSETDLKKWFANKIKQIVKEEGLKWDRNNTQSCDYLDYSSGVTVQDAYRVYDKLLGRKDYIPDPNKKEESKEIDDIESKYRQSIDKTFDIMKLYGKDNKYYRNAVKKEKDLEKQLHNLKALKNESEEVKNVLGVEEGSEEEAIIDQVTGRNFKDEFNALSKEEQDKYKELIPVNHAFLSAEKAKALAKQYDVDEGILWYVANIGKFNLNEANKKEAIEGDMIDYSVEFFLPDSISFNFEKDLIDDIINATKSLLLRNSSDKIKSYVDAEVEIEDLGGAKDRETGEIGENFEICVTTYEPEGINDKFLEDQMQDMFVKCLTKYNIKYDDISLISTDYNHAVRFTESKEVMKKELNKEELFNKLEDYVLNQYTDFNDKLYSDFGDIQMGDKDNNKRSIYIYYDIDEDKISVTVGAAGARTYVDTLDEVAQFINAEIAKVNAQDEEIKKLTTESEDIDYDYILKQIEFLQNQDSHVLTIPDDFDTLENVNISKDDKYWTILDKILKDEEKSKGVYYSIDEVLEELHEYIESKIKPVKESLDKEKDDYLKKMDKQYKTFCKNMELDEKDPEDALYAIDELEGQFGDEDGEYQELREFIHNELLESKEIKTEDIMNYDMISEYVKDISKEDIEFLDKAIDLYDIAYYKYCNINPSVRDGLEHCYNGKYIRTILQEPHDLLVGIREQLSQNNLEESKNGKYTDEEIIKAIKAQIKDNNGIFTDDSIYDVIERLTGIKDIEMMPSELYKRINDIYEIEFNK